MKHLVIVESPAKAKTIEKFLGQDYLVKSSMGHIRALPSKNGSVDPANKFAAIYEVSDDKTKVIADLKREVKNADSVWLASDEDREGEAIAWHLSEVLKLDPKTTKRIVFHEITKSALDEAIAHPRTIDSKLVEAQQARQSLDYLVGFELSPVLWRKVRPQLSAGRVQSVAVRLIVEREREIQSFVPDIWFKLTADFELKDGTALPAEAAKKYDSLELVRTVMEAFSGSQFKVTDVTKKPGTRNSSPPFTTSTLQQEASNRLGYSPRTTMQLAQRLYEAGYITYMRTDSVNLSTAALNAIGTYVTKQFGAKYHARTAYQTKSAGAQEAHEAIRPTNVDSLDAGADDQQKKLYSLIWKRAVASQMSPAQLEKTTITIEPDQAKSDLLEAKGEVVIFDGFLKVYGGGAEDTLLPTVAVGEVLKLIQAQALETLSRAPARYAEAALVRKLEEMGIGRPSTYASTITTIQTRGYVERGEVEGTERQLQKVTLEGSTITPSIETIMFGKDANKLIPTDTGVVVTDFLVKHFAEVMDYDFTKQVEQELDDIAEGQKQRVEVLDAFYKPFHKLVEASGEISRAEATQTRKLGDDPKSKLPIFARYGRYGAMLQKGEQSDDPKPQFAPLPAGASIETVTLVQALKMFELPRLVGETEKGEPIKSNIGRFGPYIQVGKVFVSIKPLDPHGITLEEARQLYADKLKQLAERDISDFGDIKVLNGRFGPYITDGTKNVKVPKDTDPKSITEEQAKKMISEAPAGKGRFRRRSTSSTTKAKAPTKKKATRKKTTKRKTTVKKK